MEIDPMCRQCQSGNYMLCENLGKKPLPTESTGAGFSPYMVMHSTQPFKVPDALSDDEAVLLEPTAVAVHGVLKQTPKPGDSVLIIGCGTIGLLLIAVVKAIEPQAEITATARYDFQSDMARKMGASEVLMSSQPDTYEKIAKKTDARYHQGFFGNKILLGGFDLVYDSIGNDSSINDALRWTRAGGHIVVLGINFKPGKIDYSPLWYQEVNLTGTNCHILNQHGESSFELAANFLADKKIDIQGMITHRFSMDNYKDAVKTFLAKGKHRAIKIVLDHT
jgi:threonine dehydrogenase-like Zn-dependent dehydrogenase